MSDIVRIGAIGCADIARRHTLPAIGRVARTELTAIASRDGAKAGEFAAEFGGAAVTGYQGLLERSDVDAVYLAVPAALHHTWARRALEAGKHVLVEKPFATNAADAADLLGLAARSGLVLMEHHKFPHHAQHAAVQAMIDDGAIGEVRSFSASFGIPPRPPSDIRYRADLGGGALLDVGVYPLKAAQLFLGDDLDVAGSLLRRDESLGVDLAGNALLIAPGGVPAELSFSLQSAYRCTYAVWGSTGRIEVSRAFTAPADFRPEVRWERQGEVSAVELATDDQAANTVRAFAEAVAGDRATAPDPAGMLRHVELLDRIRAGRTEPLPSGGDR